MYYPQALKILGELHSEMACAFLSKWPEPQKLKNIREHQLRKFLYAHNSRSEARLQERLKVIGELVVVTDDLAVIIPNRMKMQRLVHMIRDLNRSIAEHDREILPRLSHFAGLRQESLPVLADIHMEDLPGHFAQPLPEAPDDIRVGMGAENAAAHGRTLGSVRGRPPSSGAASGADN